MRTRFLLLILIAGILWLPASLAAQDTPPDGQPGVTIHVVQRDETLGDIALLYGMTTDDLVAMNGLTDPDSLQVGQRLLVPAAGAVTPTPKIHTVLPGESLKSIADLYGVDPVELAAFNGVTADNPLAVGQLLTVIGAITPEPPTPPPAAPTATGLPDGIVPTASPIEVGPTAPEGIVHVVAPGETLYRIATQYGVTVADMVAANNIADPTLIYAGQQLIVPGLTPPKIAVDLPAPVLTVTVDPLIFVEGKTGRVRLTTSAPVTVTGTFIDRALNDAAENDNTQHTILIGIPMFTEAGVYPLALTLTDGVGPQVPLTANIQVVSGVYGSEYITLQNNLLELLDPAVEDPEQALVAQIMAPFTSQRYFNGPLSLPAAATIISPYGTHRSYNGEGFTRFHQGTDFAGGSGTPVLAAAAGVVVMADALNVRGNATIIDHGWGVYTGYWHQSEQYVKPGDVVQAGQVIGLIGATGRVTGPHLHWEVWVNDTPVDPMQWVSQSFS